MRRDKTVVYLIPCPGHFVASFALSDAACQAAIESGLSPALIERIASAPKYPEGRAVRIEVRAKADVHTTARVAAIKMMGGPAAAGRGTIPTKNAKDTKT